MNPYRVLKVSRKANAEEIKRAYRELAKKYHPDRHLNQPDAQEAEKRMREINEAYARIGKMQKQKKSKKNLTEKLVEKLRPREPIPLHCEQNTTVYERVRQELKQNEPRMAIVLLQRIAERDAEWYFLMGEAFCQKKWYDEASRSYARACTADPAHERYRFAWEACKATIAASDANDAT